MPKHPKLTGLTLTAATTSLSVGIIDFQPPGASVATIDTTEYSDTYTQRDPGAITSWDAAQLTVTFDSDLDMDTHVGVKQTFTITYPVVTSGNTAANHAFTGFIESWAPGTTAIDERPTATIVIQIDGDVTVTAETTP